MKTKFFVYMAMGVMALTAAGSSFAQGVDMSGGAAADVGISGKDTGLGIDAGVDPSVGADARMNSVIDDTNSTGATNATANTKVKAKIHGSGLVKGHSTKGAGRVGTSSGITY